MDTYNVEPAEVNIIARKGDDIDMAFEVKLNDAAFNNLAAGTLKMTIKDFKGTVKKTLQSDGTSPELVLSTSTYSIIADAFEFVGSYKYDLQFNDGSKSYTIQYGKVIIDEEQTT